MGRIWLRLALLLGLATAVLVPAYAGGADLPVVSVSDFTVQEPADPGGRVAATVELTLSAPAAGAVTLIYKTADGSATVLEDYAFAGEWATIPAGSDRVTVPVLAYGDKDVEGSETFGVEIAAVSGATTGRSRGNVTILDNELPRLRISDAQADERDSREKSMMTFALTLAPASAVPVVVRFATGADTARSNDFYKRSDSLTIPAGVTEASISVSVKGDDLDEATERFKVKLTSVSGAVFSRRTAYGRIIDDIEPPLVEVADASVGEGDRGELRTLHFDLTLSVASDEPVVVGYETVGKTAKERRDYVGSEGSVTIEPGSRRAAVEVTVRGDDRDESHEKFVLKLTGVTGGTLGDRGATGKILDDD